MAEIDIVKQCVEFLDTKDDWDRGLERICRCTRIAYRSENIGKTIDEKRERNEALIKRLIFRKEGDNSPKHTSTLEHAVFGVIIHCSRAIANEFVRHRHTAYTQESTRYVNFGNKKPSFVIPSYEFDDTKLLEYKSVCSQSYGAYDMMVKNGTLPQLARDILPLGLETTMAMTTNIAEWRRIFELRCDAGAHPMARQIALTILETFNSFAPWAFSDIAEKFSKELLEIQRCEVKFA